MPNYPPTSTTIMPMGGSFIHIRQPARNSNAQITIYPCCPHDTRSYWLQRPAARAYYYAAANAHGNLVNFNDFDNGTTIVGKHHHANITSRYACAEPGATTAAASTASTRISGTSGPARTSR